MAEPATLASLKVLPLPLSPTVSMEVLVASALHVGSTQRPLPALRRKGAGGRRPVASEMSASASASTARGCADVPTTSGSGLPATVSLSLLLGSKLWNLVWAKARTDSGPHVRLASLTGAGDDGPGALLLARVITETLREAKSKLDAATTEASLRL